MIQKANLQGSDTTVPMNSAIGEEIQVSAPTIISTSALTSPKGQR